MSDKSIEEILAQIKSGNLPPVKGADPTSSNGLKSVNEGLDSVCFQREIKDSFKGASKDEDKKDESGK